MLKLRNLRRLVPLVIFGCFIFSFGSPAVAFQGQKSPGLKYGWKKGQTLTFHVKIEVDQGDYTTILAGHPTYTVRKADEDGVEFGFSGLLSESRKAKPGKRIFFRGPGRNSPFSPFTGVSPGSLGRRGGTVIKINSRGEIVSKTGSSQLPFLLGNLSELMLELLPEGNEKTWNESTDISISFSSGRIPRPSFLRDDKKLIKAKQVTTYTLGEVSANEATLKKEYHLRTVETIKGKPRFEIVGSGTVTFDLKQGSPIKLDFKQTVIERENNKTEETPLRVTYRLLTEDERETLAASRQVILENLTSNKNAEKKRVTVDEQSKIVASLQPGNQQALGAILKLQRQVPEKPNPEIAKALEEFLKSKKDSTRYSAAKALENWATEENKPALLNALDDSFPIVRHSAMIALVRLNDKETAEPIAKHLGTLQDRGPASRALKAMGENAEDAVIAQADSKEWQTRLEVVRILKAIGTKKSLATLKKLESDSNILVKKESKQAAEAVQNR